MTLEKFFFTLFNESESVNLRFLYEKERRAGRDLVHSCEDAFNNAKREKKNAARLLIFPCIGVNPRLDEMGVNKVSLYKNIVVDIDDAPLPDWAEKLLKTFG